MKKKIFKFLVKSIVTIFFLYLVVYQTNWPEVLFYLKKISLWQIILYVIVLLVGMGICAYRWKILADYKGLHFTWKEFFKFYLTGTFINNFMPSFIAGDAFKAYAIAGKEKKYSEAASTVMMDRVTGLIGIMILSLVFSLMNYRDVLANNTLILINAFIILSLCADVVITQLKKISSFKKWMNDVLPARAIIFLRDMASYNGSTYLLKKAIFISVLFSIVGIAFLNYILFWGLGVDISMIDYLSVIFLISIVSSLPISINNIGLKEWAYITFFGLFGVTSGAVVAISVISRFLQMIVSLTAMPVYLRSKK